MKPRCRNRYAKCFLWDLNIFLRGLPRYIIHFVMCVSPACLCRRRRATSYIVTCLVRLFLEAHASLVLAMSVTLSSVCLSVTLFKILHFVQFLQVLSNSFNPFHVLSSPLKSFHVIPNPFKSFQFLSSPLLSFQVLPCPFKSFKVLPSPYT